MIDEGEKVETDTSRTVPDGAFDGAWDDDANNVEPTVVEPTPDSGDAVAGTREEPAPDAGTIAAAQPSPESPALPDGYKLDTLGRVHGPDGRVIGKEEAERLLAAAKPATADTTPPVTAPVVEPPKPQAPEGEPYWVRHAGQKVTIPHTTRSADGTLTIKPEGEAVVRDLMTQALAHRESWPREKKGYDDRIAQAEAARDGVKAKYNNAAVTYHDAVVRSKDNPAPILLKAVLEEIGDEQLQERVLARWDRESNYLVRDVQHILREAELTIPKAPEAPAMDQDALIRAAQTGTVEETDAFLDVLGRDLSTEDRNDIRDAMRTHFRTFWEERPELNGELGLDRHALKAAIEREVGLRNRVREAALKAEADAKKQREALAFNQRQTTTTPTPTKPKARPLATTAAARPVSFDDAWNDDDD